MFFKSKLSKGIFIAFEGGEGVGKSTQIKHLSNNLITHGYKVRAVREPGGSAISESIRAITHNPKFNNMSYHTEALLMAASRAQLVKEVYKPLLDKKYIVLADRYVLSSYVYQGFGRKLGLDAIKKLNDFAIDGLKPDITFLLDLDYETGHKRRLLSEKVDRMDMQKKEFYKTVENAYRNLATDKKNRITSIDASLSIEEIQTIIMDKLKPLLK